MSFEETPPPSGFPSFLYIAVDGMCHSLVYCIQILLVAEVRLNKRLKVKNMYIFSMTLSRR